MLKTVSAGMLIMLTTTVSALGHDYWLQPQPFFLSKGETTRVHLFVGDHFVGEAERPFQPAMTVDFQFVRQKVVTDLKIAAKAGDKPVATITPENPGSYLIAMERDWSHIEIEADKFNEYLEHEGLSNILHLRSAAGEGRTVGRERYRRYLKALVQVEDVFDETYKRRLGHRLEILPHANPSTLDMGDLLAVSVLFDGKPLRSAQVTAYNRKGANTVTQAAKTDDTGQVQFLLEQNGLWLIRLVYMKRCRDIPECDWESFWAAYSFQLK